MKNNFDSCELEKNKIGSGNKKVEFNIFSECLFFWSGMLFVMLALLLVGMLIIYFTVNNNFQLF